MQTQLTPILCPIPAYKQEGKVYHLCISLLEKIEKGDAGASEKDHHCSQPVLCVNFAISSTCSSSLLSQYCLPYYLRNVSARSWWSCWCSPPCSPSSSASCPSSAWSRCPPPPCLTSTDQESPATLANQAAACTTSTTSQPAVLCRQLRFSGLEAKVASLLDWTDTGRRQRRLLYHAKLLPFPNFWWLSQFSAIATKFSEPCITYRLWNCTQAVRVKASKHQLSIRCLVW